MVRQNVIHENLAPLSTAINGKHTHTQTQSSGIARFDRAQQVGRHDLGLLIMVLLLLQGTRLCNSMEIKGKLNNHCLHRGWKFFIQQLGNKSVL